MHLFYFTDFFAALMNNTCNCFFCLHDKIITILIYYVMLTEFSFLIPAISLSYTMYASSVFLCYFDCNRIVYFSFIQFGHANYRVQLLDTDSVFNILILILVQ